MKQKLCIFAAGVMAAIALVFTAACVPSEPKEADSEDNLSYREYNVLLSSLRGGALTFDYEGCTIELTLREDIGSLYLDQFQDECCLDWERLTDEDPDEYAVDKYAHFSDLPIRFEDKADVQWVVDHFGLEEGETAENYLTVIAEQDEYITGYAVVCLSADREGTAVEVVANKDFPKIRGKYQEVDRAWLDEHIETLISEHENEN